MKKMQLMIIAGLLIIGFIYRMVLSGFALPDIIWDMESYHKMALEFLSGKIIADCCMKTVGYGVFLGIIYRIFGPDNLGALTVIQSLLDLGTALLLYRASGRIFDQKTALTVFVLYIINPFTSAYAGFRLAEVLTIFVITSVIYLLAQIKPADSLKYWFIFGAANGILLFIRQQYQLFVAVLMFLPFIYPKINLKRKISLFVASAAGLIVFSGYTLTANYLNFGKISFGIPYPSTFVNLYMNFYSDLRYPELAVNLPNVHPEFTEISVERHTVSLEDKPGYENKFKNLFFSRIRTDWPLFLTNYFRNMIWIWDKYYLFVYDDRFYPDDSIPAGFVNILLLFLGGTGLTGYLIRSGKKIFKSTVFIYSALLLSYVTFTFPLVSNESRHTIAAYPVVILWAGYGLAKISSGKNQITGH
jgi:4-amino-4-deoxy-L-arabinose transferase-like glycosyltransferase